MNNFNKRVVLGGFPVLVVIVAILSACSFSFLPASEQDLAADDEGWTEEGVREVVEANNQFAFDLYRDLSREKQDNLFFSPYSISLALAMTCEGAQEETAEEIRDVFSFPAKEILRPNSARIYNRINREEKPYELRTGNALWVEKDFALKDDYAETVKKYYGGRAVDLDFVNQPEQSRDRINRYIAGQTNDRIKELLPKGVPNRFTRLILTNAIYFLGDWKYQFDQEETEKMPFYISSEESVDVPMMFMEPEESFYYADLDEMKLLEMPYRGEDLSMLVLLPEKGGELADLDLTSEKLNSYREEMEKTNLDGIYFPKFKLETEYELGDHLQRLGMPTAFTKDADFSGMNELEDLFISEVFHKAFVEVDEEGTEAAAATGVVMKTTAVQPEINFKADRPFLFLIQEQETGHILFMGRVNEPVE